MNVNIEISNEFFIVDTVFCYVLYNLSTVNKNVITNHKCGETWCHIISVYTFKKTSYLDALRIQWLSKFTWNYSEWWLLLFSEKVLGKSKKNEILPKL